MVWDQLQQKLLLYLNMKTDMVDLPSSDGSGCGSESDELHHSNSGPSGVVSEPSSSEIKEKNVDKDNLGYIDGEVGKETGQVMEGIELDKNVVDNPSILQDNVVLTESVMTADELNCSSSRKCIEGDVGNGDSQVIEGIDLHKDLVDNPSILQDDTVMTETVMFAEELNSFSSRVHTANGCLTAQEETIPSNRNINDNTLSGLKRARVTFDEQKPVVHVIYSSLTRDSKLKLEELLKQWSEWHARHCSSSHDSSEVLESGEVTYFPALHIGLNKSSAVSFWLDNQTRNAQSSEFNLNDSDSAPLYDRGFALGLTLMDGSSNLEGGMDSVDASRCFNCGSYNHSLKECPKPRDNAAVNNARKQLKSKRGQTAGSRNASRYYQNSPGGKYDGLKPGVLGAETRQLLGLGELDPPPWLNRMREIGYPPGYLDPEEVDIPSGITIFTDGEETKQETEDGEILETDVPIPAPQRKMSVEFPGINAPIPENVDERRWSCGASSSDPYRNRSNRRLNNHSSELNSNKGNYRDQRWLSRDYRDDAPPRWDPEVSYSERYDGGGGDSRYSSHNLGRSLSERSRRSGLVREDSSTYDLRSSFHYSSLESSSQVRERYDGHHYRSRR